VIPIEKLFFGVDVAKQITRFRFKLGESMRAEKNRALTLIFLKYSNYDDPSPFGTFSDASMALLEQFTYYI